MRRFLLLVAAFTVGAAHAAEPIGCFADAERDAHYREFIHTIRCMKCQNQSIAESQIDQAGDIRRQTCELMRDDGLTDGEIRNYLAERYGDFINFLPPWKPSTWLLWSSPALLLAGGGVVFVRVLRKRMQQPLDEDLGLDEDVE